MWFRDRVRVEVTVSVTVYSVVYGIYGKFHIVDTVTVTSPAHPDPLFFAVTEIAKK